MQRRLLPVAILLVAALVAIPFLLAKDPEPVAAPERPRRRCRRRATRTRRPADPRLARGRRRARPAPPRPGRAKNPFQPGPAPKAGRTPTPAGETRAVDRGTPVDHDKPAGGDSAAAGRSPCPGSPAPARPQAPLLYTWA